METITYDICNPNLKVIAEYYVFEFSNCVEDWFSNSKNYLDSSISIHEDCDSIVFDVLDEKNMTYFKLKQVIFVFFLYFLISRTTNLDLSLM